MTEITLTDAALAEHARTVDATSRQGEDIGGLLIDTRPWTPEEVQEDYLRGMGVW